MTKRNPLRAKLLIGGALLAGLAAGQSQATCPRWFLPAPACRFIHYFEATSQVEQLSLLERVMASLMMATEPRPADAATTATPKVPSQNT